MMNLKSVLIYLHTQNLKKISSTNLRAEHFNINENTDTIELTYSPYSKNHIFIFIDDEYVDSSIFEINNNKTIKFLTNVNDKHIDVYYFQSIERIQSDNIEETSTLDIDEFIGGNNNYVLKIGALDEKCILVTVNNKIITEYTIENGVLNVDHSTPTDTIRVYYLNRGFIERRAKIGLHQINDDTVRSRYQTINNTYTKNEFDSKFHSLKGNLPIGLTNLQKIAEAIVNHPNYYQYVQNELSKLSDIGHTHDIDYNTRFQTYTILDGYNDISEMLDIDQILDKIDEKIDISQVYTKTEFDQIISNLPGNNPNNRGIFISGGANNNPQINTNLMDIINISSTTNAAFFGNFQTAKRGLTGTSNGIGNTGIISGGNDTTSVFSVSILNNNQTSYFGDLIYTRNYATSNSNGSGNIGIIMGGNQSTRNMEFKFINNNQTIGSIFGMLSSEASSSVISSVSSGKNDRIVFGPVYSNNTNVYTTEYFTPSTLTNSQLFGELTTGYQYVSGTSNDINDRGVFSGGIFNNTGLFTSHVQYLNIGVLSNSQHFGELIQSRGYATSISNGINNRAVIAGGNIGMNSNEYGYTNKIEYFNITNPSTANQFGNLTLARGDNMAGISNGAL